MNSSLARLMAAAIGAGLMAVGVDANDNETPHLSETSSIETWRGHL